MILSEWLLMAAEQIAAGTRPNVMYTRRVPREVSMPEPTVDAQGVYTRYPCGNCGELTAVPMIADCLCHACAWQGGVAYGSKPQERGGFSQRMKVTHDNGIAWLYRTAVPGYPVTFRIEPEDTP